MTKLLLFYYENQLRFVLIALFVIRYVILVYVLPYFKQKWFVHFLMKPYLTFIIYILFFLILHILFNIETVYAEGNDAFLTYKWIHKSQIPDFNPRLYHKISNDTNCLNLTIYSTNGTKLLDYVVAPIDHNTNPWDLASYNIYEGSKQLKRLWLVADTPEEMKPKATQVAVDMIISERKKAGYNVK